MILLELILIKNYSDINNVACMVLDNGKNILVAKGIMIQTDNDSFGVKLKNNI